MNMKPLAEVDAGDYHFALKKSDDGKYQCLRSDISDPMRNPEVVTDMQDIPPTVFSIFNGLMF